MVSIRHTLCLFTVMLTLAFGANEATAMQMATSKLIYTQTEVSGGDCAAGLAAGVAQSLYAGYVDRNGLDKAAAAETAALIGAGVGFLFSSGKGENVSIGNTTAQSGFVNNYLSHDDLANFIHDLEECKAKEGGCSRQEQSDLADKYMRISHTQDRELRKCFDIDCVDALMADAVSPQEVLEGLEGLSPYLQGLFRSDHDDVFGIGILKPTHDIVLQNFDFFDGYQDYLVTKCGGVSSETCIDNYQVAYGEYLEDIQTVQNAKVILALVTGAIFLGPELCLAKPHLCLALEMADVAECAAGEIVACATLGPGTSATLKDDILDTTTMASRFRELDGTLSARMPELPLGYRWAADDVAGGNVILRPDGTVARTTAEKDAIVGYGPATNGTGFDDLARFRNELDLPPAGSATDRSTLAVIEVNGQQIYGINGHGQSVTGVNAISRTHAEIDALNQIQQRGIDVRGQNLTLYVDRTPCTACNQNGGIRSMVEKLGLNQLTVIGPDGSLIIRPR